MKEVIKYIKEMLDTDLVLSPISNSQNKNIPFYLAGAYKFYWGKIQGNTVVFAEFQQDTMLSPGKYAKHELIIKNALQAPVVFVFRNIQSYNRKRLVSNKINFIVPNSQIYLPDLWINISNKGDRKNKNKNVNHITPTAQTILLYYFLQNSNDFTYAHLQEVLGMPYPTICKAIETLNHMKLCEAIGSRSKIVHFAEDKAGLFEQSAPLMKSPVKRMVYSDTLPKKSYRSGIYALSDYTMINPPEWKQVAISQEEYKKLESYSNDDFLLPFHIEVWSYDPGHFAQNGLVDKISLYLSLKENADERVQHELKQMIRQLW